MLAKNSFVKYFLINSEKMVPGERPFGGISQTPAPAQVLKNVESIKNPFQSAKSYKPTMSPGIQ